MRPWSLNTPAIPMAASEVTILRPQFNRIDVVPLLGGGLSFGTDPSARLNEREIKALLGSPTTADHHRPAEHYRVAATEFMAKHAEHGNEATEYYRNPAVIWCRIRPWANVATVLRGAAKRVRPRQTALGKGTRRLRILSRKPPCPRSI